MIQDIATGYLAGVAAMMAIGAVRTPHEEVRPFSILCLFWPITLVLIIFSMLANLIGWNLDIDRGNKKFGIRGPGNPNASGFAVSVFGVELRVFKSRNT